MSVYNLLDIFYYTLTACLAVILRQTIPIFCLEGISIYVPMFMILLYVIGKDIVPLFCMQDMNKFKMIDGSSKRVTANFISHSSLQNHSELMVASH